MANSTARTIVNFALEANGLMPIPDDAAYIDPTQLDKYQRQATLLLDLIQRKFAISFNKRFNQRLFTFQTVAPNPNPTVSYSLDSVMIEGFRANNFHNVTTAGVYNQKIAVMTYEMWRDRYPRPDLESSAAPRWIIPLPDAGDGSVQVMVWPYADQVYTIEGICRLPVSPIVAGSDQILFPVNYEHSVILTLMAWLETRLNEGREASMMLLAEQCVEEVLRDATGAYEEQDPMDLGIVLYGGGHSRSVRDYNPSTDTVTPFS